MRTNRFARALALSVFAAIAGQAIAQPATTAFTYQGRLTAGGVAQSTNYDFQFKLFDAAVGGSQLGGTIALSPVPVAGGLFTTNLDFGQQFNSSRRWLEIGVHLTGAGGGFQTLTPRQELTAAPQSEGLVLPLVANTSSGGTGFAITNTLGDAIRGTGGGNGVYATSTGTNGNGIYASANTGTIAYGVWGQSSTGFGVVGDGLSGGGYFDASSPTGYGVTGWHLASTGTTAGVEGDTNSTDSNALAVFGHVVSTSPGGSSTAVRGTNEGTGGLGIGVWGSQNGSGYGVLGTVSGSGIGVFGIASGAGGYGVLASSGGVGVSASGSSFGVDASAGTGVRGTSNAAGGYGVLGVGGSSSVGVRGESSSGGGGSYGVYGFSSAAAGNGIRGECSNGSGSYGVWGVSSTGYAGFFSGNVNVAGTLSKSGGAFKIDHPLDPANKYLWHSFVESPDMKNIYDGNAQLDAGGSVTISMPDWFEALNTDFRYQLTAVGAPGPNLYVSQPMKNGRFVISGGTPGGVVSWQVTGVRQDAWANAHRIPIEQVKAPEERGRYIHPELFGMPASASIDAIKTAPGALPASAPAPTLQPMGPVTGLPVHTLPAKGGI